MLYDHLNEDDFIVFPLKEDLTQYKYSIPLNIKSFQWGLVPF